MRKLKIKPDMHVRVHTNAREGFVRGIDVPRDVRPDEWNRIERVGKEDLILVQYKWQPGGGPSVASVPHHYGVYPVDCLTTIDGRFLRC